MGVITKTLEDLQREVDSLRLRVAELEDERRVMSAPESHARVEGMLRDSEERLRLAIETSKIGVWDWDIYRNAVSWTESLYQLHGITHEQFGGTVESFSSLVHADDRERVELAIQGALRRNEPYEIEFRAVRPDGKVIWLFTNARVLHDTSGAPVRMIGATLDITRSKQSEEAIRESEWRFRSLADSAPTMIWMTNLDGCEFVNRECLRYLGMLGDAVARDIDMRAYVHPVDRDAFAASVDTLLRDGTSYSAQLRLLRHDGTYRWMQAVAVPRYSLEGIIGYTGSFTDVDDIKRIEQALRKAEQQLRTVTDLMRTSVARCSADWRFIWVNPSYAARYNLAPEDIEGKPVPEILGEEGCETIRPYVERVLSGEYVEYELPIKLHRIGECWIRASYAPTTDAGGNVDGWVAVVSDITQQKEMEIALQASHDELEARVQERTMLLRELALELTEAERRERKRLARVLHDDLQQLLVAVKMHVGFARSDPEPAACLDEVQRLLNDAIASCRSLAVGLSPPALRDSDLPDAMEWLAGHMLDQHGLRVNVSLAGALPALPEDTRAFLYDIARELLFNVVKHAGVGEANIAIRAKDGRIALEVSDKGNGCDSISLQRAGRDSIGLFSIRERVAGLGGTFEAEGARKAGCRICVALPIPADQQS